MDFNFNDIGKILIALSTVIGVIYASIKSFTRFSNIDMNRWKNVLKRKKLIKPLLNDLVYSDENICRASLLYLKNGGGVPHAGSQIYSNILMDACIPPLQDYTSRWQDVRVEGEYLNILSKLAIEGVVHIVTKDLQPGVLKDAGESEGIDSFYLYYIKATKNKWFYLAISSCNSNFKFNAEQRDKIRVLKYKLSKLVK